MMSQSFKGAKKSDPGEETGREAGLSWEPQRSGGGATHSLRVAKAATARPRCSSPPARPRGSATGFPASPSLAVQGHFHRGTPPRRPGPSGAAEGSRRQRVSTDCTLHGSRSGILPSVIYTDLSILGSSERYAASSPKSDCHLTDA